MTGRLIAVEGLDGVGKTTLSQALADYLGAEWITTPDASLRPLRQVVDEGWSHAPDAQRLFYAAAVVAAGRRAEALTRAGRDVVVDRYWLTTVVYAEVAGAPLDRAVLERRVRPADATLLLDVDERVRAARLAARGATDADRWSLACASRLRAAYDQALAGPTLRVDGGRSGVSALVAFARRWLDSPCARGQQLALF